MTASAKEIARRGAKGFINGTFAIALALLFVLMLRSIAVQISPPPGPVTAAYPDISTKETCEAAGGTWTISTTSRFAQPQPLEPSVVEKVKQEFCQGPLAFERTREIQSEKNRQASLFVFALGGGVAVAASLLVARLKPVAPGLMLGGIASFFIAAIHIWTLAPGIGRLATIVVIFIILTFVGTKALADDKKS